MSCVAELEDCRFDIRDWSHTFDTATAVVDRLEAITHLGDITT